MHSLPCYAFLAGLELSITTSDTFLQALLRIGFLSIGKTMGLDGWEIPIGELLWHFSTSHLIPVDYGGRSLGEVAMFEMTKQGLSQCVDVY